MEANDKHAEEVRRIMIERGFIPANSGLNNTPCRTKKEHSFGRFFGIALVGLVVIAALTGGLFYLFRSKESIHTSIAGTPTTFINDNANDTSDYYSIDPQSMLQFDTLTDEEYEQRLAEINAEYEHAMAEIDAESARRQAEIQERADQYELEFQQRYAERQAERERLDSEYAEQQATYEQQEQQQAAVQAAIDAQTAAKAAICAQYEGQTAEELAANDSEVRSAKHTLDAKVKAYNKAYNDLYKSNVVLTEGQRAPRREKYNAAKSEMDEASYAYNTILNNTTAYYRRQLAGCE